MFVTIWRTLFPKREKVVTPQALERARNKLTCTYIQKMRRCRNDVHLEKIMDAYRIGRYSDDMGEIERSAAALKDL